MSAPLTTTSALMDIEPLALPAESDVAIVLTALTIIIIFIFLATFVMRRYLSPRYQARRHLQQLEKKIKKVHRKMTGRDNVKKETREISYQLAHIFATGTKLNGVTLSTTLPVKLNHQQQRWQDFTRELSAARYDHQHCNPASLDMLFKETLFFLKNWP